MSASKFHTHKKQQAELYITQRRMIITCRRFGTTYRSHFKRSGSPKRCIIYKSVCLNMRTQSKTSWPLSAGPTDCPRNFGTELPLYPGRWQSLLWPLPPELKTQITLPVCSIFCHSWCCHHLCWCYRSTKTHSSFAEVHRPKNMTLHYNSPLKGNQP